jgi:alpha-glucosidase (family GH31 glycosyl hydrolase)
MLPYIPTGKDLETNSISLDAYHKGNNATELDMHSLFGTLEAATTSNWFTTQNKRPMIFEEGGFAGIGKYSSRWMGDNYPI